MTEEDITCTPVDYEPCGNCGYDHAYEPFESALWHLNELSEHVCKVMYIDSRIELDKVAVKEAIISDARATGVVLTFEDIELLCMGDDDGTIPDELKDMCPALNALLEQQF